MKNILLIFLLLFPSIVFARDYTSDSRCVAAYLFKEGSGTTVADSSRNGFGGTGTFLSSGHPAWDVSVPSFTKYGSATKSASFATSGTTDKITASTSNSVMPVGSPLTITAWIYPTVDDVGGFNPRIVDRSTTGNDGITFAILPTKAIYFDTVDLDTGTSGILRISNNNSITFNTWQFVAVTWDGSITATNVHIYVNGVEVGYATSTSATSLNSNAGHTLYIGNRPDTQTPLGGKITQVGVFNAVLNSSELSDIYNYGLTGNGSFLSLL